MALRGIVTPLLACGPAGGSVAKGMKKISYRGYRFPASRRSVPDGGALQLTARVTGHVQQRIDLEDAHAFGA